MDRHNELTRYGLAVTHYPPSVVARRGWSSEVLDWLTARATELGLPLSRRRGAIAPSVGIDPSPLVVRGRFRP
jgi:hypothetical protein